MTHDDACLIVSGGVLKTLPDDPIFTCTTASDNVEHSDSSWDGAGEEVKSRRIMIVDDEPFNIKLIHKQLIAPATAISSPPRTRRGVEPGQAELSDVLLLDIVMPGMSGLSLLKEIRGDAAIGHLPVIMVTAANDAATKNEALESAPPICWINRWIPRNWASACGTPSCSNRNSIDCGVGPWTWSRSARRTAELDVSRLELIQCLGRAGEFRDNETGRHVIRVARYVAIIAHSLGLDEKTVKLIAETSTLHDMGKIGLPDRILLKPGA